MQLSWIEDWLVLFLLSYFLFAPFHSLLPFYIFRLPPPPPPPRLLLLHHVPLAPPLAPLRLLFSEFSLRKPLSILKTRSSWYLFTKRDEHVDCDSRRHYSIYSEIWKSVRVIKNRNAMQKGIRIASCIRQRLRSFGCRFNTQRWAGYTTICTGIKKIKTFV